MHNPTSVVDISAAVQRSSWAHSDSTLIRAGASRAAQIALPSCLMFLLALWRISGPSYWRDEAATLSAVKRPFPVLWQMLGRTDVVHSVYYLLMWPIIHTFGTGEIVLRMPSALAAALAAGGVAAIARRIASYNVALTSGL